MPSSNNVETMFVQHYSEKGRSHRSGNVAVSHKSAMMPQVVLQDDDYKVGSDAATETSLVSYCFLSSIIPQECGSGNYATIKINQDGDDAASRPMRRRFKTAVMPQVVL
jgi:hypothetical protein